MKFRNCFRIQAKLSANEYLTLTRSIPMYSAYQCLNTIRSFHRTRIEYTNSLTAGLVETSFFTKLSFKFAHKTIIICWYKKHSLRALSTPSRDLRVPYVNPMVEKWRRVISNFQPCQLVGTQSQVESLPPTMNLELWLKSRFQKCNPRKKKRVQCNKRMQKCFEAHGLV